MHDVKQMIELGPGHMKVQRQQELDDGWIERYHDIGTSPLLWKLTGVVTVNFATKGRCPSSFPLFDNCSHIVTSGYFVLQQCFCISQVRKEDSRRIVNVYKFIG